MVQPARWSALFGCAIVACSGGGPTDRSKPPTATLHIEPLGEPIVDVTRLSFEGSAAGAAGPLTFHWDFGDGSTASGPNVEHVYHSLGLFGIRLVVDGPSGSMAARGSVRVRSLSGGWYSPRTNSPFTSPGFPIDFNVNLRQSGERLGGEVPSLAWCPIYRDPVTGLVGFAPVAGVIRHPLTVSFSWICGRFEGVMGLWEDTLNDPVSGEPIYFRR